MHNNADEIAWQNLLSFFKREYDNTFLNVSALTFKRILQISLISLFSICSLILIGFGIVSAVMGITSDKMSLSGGFLMLCLCVAAGVYFLSISNRILLLVTRDYHKETLELFQVHKKLFIRECAGLLGIGPRKAKSILEELCDMGLCELHITSEGQLLYVLIDQENQSKENSIKPDFS